MSSLFIILVDGSACVVESIDDRFAPVCIKGEERILINRNQASWFIQELVANLGVDDFQEWSVAIVYDSVASDVLSPLLTGIFLHKPAALEVRTLESLLPEVLLKRKMIAPGESLTVALGSKCWHVALTGDGRVSEFVCPERTTPDVSLVECDIPCSLSANYAFLTNRKELEQTEAKLLEMTKQWKSAMLQIEEIESHLQSEIQIKEDVLKKYADMEKILNEYSYVSEYFFENICKTNKDKPLDIIKKDNSNQFDSLNNIISVPFQLFGNYLGIRNKRINDDLKCMNFDIDCERLKKSGKIKDSVNSYISKDALMFMMNATNEIIIEKFFHYVSTIFEINLSEIFICETLDNPKCPMSVWNVLSSDNDARIRKIVVEHPRCPNTILEVFLKDSSSSIQKEARRRLKSIPG